MKAKCTICGRAVRINGHRVFLQHTHTLMVMMQDKNNGNKIEVPFASMCKGSFKKAKIAEP